MGSPRITKIIGLGFFIVAFFSIGIPTPTAIAADEGVSDLRALSEPGFDTAPPSQLGFSSAIGSTAASAGDSGSSAGMVDADIDPWEPFNEKMFAFNRQFDRFVLKPVATAWNFILPDPVQRSVHNALVNIDVVRRVTNNVLQLKFNGAGREVGRFVINSTIGVAGLFDVAKNQFGIEESNEDTGQTFGVWGVNSGPFLVLPLLPVTTVRDGIGMAFDAAMNPLSWTVLPIAATIGMYATYTINERSMNLQTYEQVEESVIDLYSAVRNGFLQRREAAVRE
jgi:phospholipid-binding lipoprotein MlaA